MPHYTSYDGTELAYQDRGEGPVLLALAGGPGRDAAYLGDLGGLDRGRRLVVPDSRGTGGSPPAGDPRAYSFPGSPRTSRRSARTWAWSASRCSRTTRPPRPRRCTPPPTRSG